MEIGGKLGGPMQPSPAHLAGHGGGFSQLQLQQQDSVLYVLLALRKTNLSFVVMMSAVDLWKALHLPRSVALTRKGKSVEV